MAYVSIVVLLLSIVCVARGVQQQYSSHITLGSSLSPIFCPTSWPSPSGRFAFGFYQQGNGFAVGIWLIDQNKKIVVWTANRDDPPVRTNAKLELSKNGELLLTTDEGEKRITANTTGSASSASMLDSGNFVLYSKDNNTIWDSFQHPTDTLLGGQNLYTGNQLISSLSETNHSTGRFRLKMQDDGNLVLYPLNTGDTPGNAYWSTGTYGSNNKYHLYLNSATGFLQLINNTDMSTVTKINDFSSRDEYYYNNYNNNSTATVYRATLDVDGIFRLYSHMYDSSGGLNTYLKWFALMNSCKVKGFCGFNSFCVDSGNQSYCQCLPGSAFIDPDQSTHGCKRNYSEAECNEGEATKRFYNITPMENIVWEGSPYSKEQMSIEECGSSCLEDCICEAALFVDGYCRKERLPLAYVTRVFDENYVIAFLKVGLRSLEVGNETPPMLPLNPHKQALAVAQTLLLVLGLVTFSCVSFGISGLFIYKCQVQRYRRLLEKGNLGLTDELTTLQLFSYNKLRRATNNFKDELGKGSFGAVYKGTLNNGRKPIAVKRLQKLVEEGEREFQAEMQAIGRSYHRNLVRLLGYCAEDSKRLLVYEYMSNGSLADLLFRSPIRPNWNERVKIALDVAKGILYLHEECEAPIIHCDIKPQNILMDDFWTAKISDFGLAKLLMPDQTRTFTIVRGTRGYMAPEWHKSSPISVKADIYSFGIVVLEIVCCRRNMDINVSKPEEIILSNWVYNCFAAKELDKLVLGEEVVDTKSLERMVKVALWCIQEEPAIRPSIKSVVLMLEGITEISIPPCPTAATL